MALPWNRPLRFFLVHHIDPWWTDCVDVVSAYDEPGALAALVAWKVVAVVELEPNLVAHMGGGQHG